MPCSHHISVSTRSGVIHLWGKVDGAQLLEEVRRFAARNELRPGWRMLWDARSVEALDLAPEDIAAIDAMLAHLRRRLGAGRSAVVAGAPDVVTSALLFKALARHDPARQIELFHDRGEAMRWLGLRPAG